MSKTEAESIIRISTSYLKNEGYFRGYTRRGSISWTASFTGKTDSVMIEVSTSGDTGSLRIQYTQTAPGAKRGEDFDYQIPLTTTPCHFGGKRYWFRCPWYNNGKFCGRRVGVLFKDGDYFACRHCYNITYSSRNENRRHIPLIPLFDAIPIHDEIVRLEGEMTTPYYRGKPTKKKQKIQKLYKKLEKFTKYMN